MISRFGNIPSTCSMCSQLLIFASRHSLAGVDSAIRKGWHDHAEYSAISKSDVVDFAF